MVEISSGIDVEDSALCPDNTDSFNDAIADTCEANIEVESEEPSAVKVCIRVRPLLEPDLSKGDASTKLKWDTDANQIMALGRSQHESTRSTDISGGDKGDVSERIFKFDRVFAPETSQDEVFNGCGVAGLVEKVLEGFHSTVFAYGQTGSGKTHTMEGFKHLPEKSASSKRSDQICFDAPPEHMGLVPRAIAAIFAGIERRRVTSSDTFVVRLSFLQIYNEKVYDLLNPVHIAAAGGAKASDASGLRLRWNSQEGSVVVENLFVFECRSASEACAYYQKGVQNRVVASHQMNQASSRSHCIFTLTVERRSPGGLASDLRTAKLTLVDLAGSERQSDTQATGKTFRESVSINQSLFVLRKVITALAKRQTRAMALIPYRESKLTTLLRDAVGGSSFTLMIACLSAGDSHYDENLATLHYAMTAGRIKNRPALNLDPKSAMIRDLRSQVSSLRNQLYRAHEYIVRITGKPLPEALHGGAIGSIPDDMLTTSLSDGQQQSSGARQTQISIGSNGSACVVPRRPPQLPSSKSGRGSSSPRLKPTQQGELVSGMSNASIGSEESVSEILDEALTRHRDDQVGKENDARGDGWSRLSKQDIASRLCESVAALRDVVVENANLYRNIEALEAERDDLRQKSECLERELEEHHFNEPSGHNWFETELARALTGSHIAPHAGNEGDLRYPLRDVSQTSVLANIHAALFFDVLGLRNEAQQLQQHRNQLPSTSARRDQQQISMPSAGRGDSLSSQRSSRNRSMR